MKQGIDGKARRWQRGSFSKILHKKLVKLFFILVQQIIKSGFSFMQLKPYVIFLRKSWGIECAVLVFRAGAVGKQLSGYFSSPFWLQYIINQRLFGRNMNFSRANGSFLNEVGEEQPRQCTSQPLIVVSAKEDSKARDTQAGQKQDQSYLWFMKTDPQDLPPQEISFQKNFLAQHIKTLAFILQKSKESNPPASTSDPPDDPLPHLQTKQPPNCKKALYALANGLVGACQALSHEQFMKDLKRQRDLEQFLEYVVGEYGSALAGSLIIAAIDIWAEVRSLSLKQLEIRDFRRLAANFSKRKAQDYSQRQEFQGLKGMSQWLRGTQNEEEILPKFKELIKRWAATILLIVGGYFVNPFSEGEDDAEEQDQIDYPKRQLSVSIGFNSYQDIFSEEEFSLGPGKKVKRK